MSEVKVKPFRPMLAATLESNAVEKLKFPVLVSPKIDGIRAIVKDGVVYSRSMKPIPNQRVQDLFGKPEYEGFDGELILGEPTDKDLYNKTMEVMAHHPRDIRSFDERIKFLVFDLVNNELPYEDRYEILKSKEIVDPRVKILKSEFLVSTGQLNLFEGNALEEGFEGVMIRDPKGLYKQGRSTPKQGWLLKLKRFEDSEAEVIGWEPFMKTIDGITIDERGYRKTSTRKDTKEAQELLGNLKVKDIKTGIEFEIGSGFDLETRKSLWESKENLIGKVVKYKHFTIGAMEKPRFPVFLGMRDELDMVDY